MECNIGQMALLGDVWYQVMEKRYGINEQNGYEGNEYLLHTKNDWIPEDWIKGVKDKEEELK